MNRNFLMVPALAAFLCGEVYFLDGYLDSRRVSKSILLNSPITIPKEDGLVHIASDRGWARNGFSTNIPLNKTTLSRDYERNPYAIARLNSSGEVIRVDFFGYNHLPKYHPLGNRGNFRAP